MRNAEFCGMKFSNIFLALILITIFTSCGSNGQYGQPFEATKAVPVTQALSMFNEKGSTEFIIKGEITKVCQTEGCWFYYKTDTSELFVDFGHKFEIPMNSTGKTAVAKGYFYRDTTSVEQLKEYAKDDKKTEAEINAITEPEVQVIFHATGVFIDPKK